MEYAAGVILALIIAIGARFIGFDQDRSFYPMVMIFIAIIYVIFAAMGSAYRIIGIESAIAIGFTAVAVLGYRKNLWIVVGALLAHGALDYVHAGIVGNPVVPAWWPGFCLAVDATLALWFAAMLLRRPATAP